MRIVLAGASGFLGRPLAGTLRSAGHQVTRLVRRPAVSPDQQRWDPGSPVTLPGSTDAVINLSGVGVADHRWTEEYKRQILLSRVQPTATLARAVANQRIPILLNASAVGYYGETGDAEVMEDSPAGEGFLADVCRQWEARTNPAELAGARVVLLRTGIVLHRGGGFLKPQLLPFKMGVGGRLGSGRQWVSWISLADWLSAVRFLLDSENIAGPVNLVGPKPVRNRDFTRAFAAELHRPALVPMVPKVAIQVVYGAFAEEAFRSIRALPAVLTRAGFPFQHRSVSSALHAAFTEDIPAIAATQDR